MRIKRELFEKAIDDVFSYDFDMVESIIADGSYTKEDADLYKSYIRMDKVLKAILNGEKVSLYD